MYSMRQLEVADRSRFRELRQTALTVNPDDFLVTPVTSLFVDPAHRRAGIGRMLLEELLTRAKSSSLEAVRLEVVASNHAAIALYESVGFVPYGCEPGAYRMGGRGWDLLLMTRSL